MNPLLAFVFATTVLFIPALAAQEKSQFLGMHVGNETNVEKAIPQLKDLGVSWVRLWADVDWTHREHPSFEKARKFHAAGFRVILTLSSHSTKRVPVYDEVKSYCDWLQKVPGLSTAVEIWEIQNELHLERYWPGTAREYVDQVLRPAWDSFHPAGEKVLAGSFSAYQEKGKLGTRLTEEYVAAGYLDYCDYAGVHPYTHSVAEMKKFLTRVRAVFGSKPIIITEWNFKQQKDWSRWSEMLNEALPFLRQHAEVICYYRLLGSKGEGGWPGALKQDYSPQEPFTSTIKSWTAVSSAANPE
jgi:hypothetical protein